MRRARADALADLLKHRSPLRLDDQAFSVLAVRGLNRAGVDAAVNDLHDAGRVTLQIDSGFVLVVLAERDDG